MRQTASSIGATRRCGSLRFGALGLFAVVLLAFVAVAPAARADSRADVIKGLNGSGYYISDAVAKVYNTGKPTDLKTAQSALADAISDGNKKGSPTKIAVIDNTILNGTSVDSYAATLFNQLNMPQDTGVLVVYQVANPSGQIKVIAPKLTDANLQYAINQGRATLADDPAKGSALVARSAFGQIDTKKASESGGLITTIVLILAAILAVIAVVVAGRIALHRSRLSKLQTQVSAIDTMVLDLSDNVDYLPDSVRERAKSDFLTGSSRTYALNEQVRALKAATPIDLLFKNGEITQKFAALQQDIQISQNALGNVKQLVQANK